MYNRGEFQKVMRTVFGEFEFLREVEGDFLEEVIYKRETSG